MRTISMRSDSCYQPSTPCCAIRRPGSDLCKYGSVTCVNRVREVRINKAETTAYKYLTRTILLCDTALRLTVNFLTISNRFLSFVHRRSCFYFFVCNVLSRDFFDLILPRMLIINQLYCMLSWHKKHIR